MKTFPILKTLTASALLLALAGTTDTAQATVLLSDDFNHATDTNSAGLSGETADVGGVSWLASTSDVGGDFTFDIDGSFNKTNLKGSSATLAFTPDQGTIYQLDGSVSNYSTVGDAWIGFGFVKGQSQTFNDTNRFLGSSTTGRAWTLLRSDGNGNTFMDATGNPSNFSALSGTGNDFDLRIVLDTTGGATNWKVTWYGKRSSESAYTLLRAETDLATEDITSVGFAATAGAADRSISGTLESITLTEVPEPGSLALMGLGGLLIASRRRRG